MNPAKRIIRAATSRCHFSWSPGPAPRSPHQVALRQVDLRWYRTFFGRAIEFYRLPPFPVLQVAWPDVDDRFHWEEQAEERHRESQPQLWLPPSEHPVGIWTTEL
ncbi:DUF4262 domain-containing protein [Streptomyces sp. NBC_01669]|uniref:DUF4262 domain-containing protein n=1 Tax=Streptomyces sp. NBC_01669 TaxID=2975909 RepID=UPI00224E1B93|nr:DUF4262 domain-containing protein [Streptomyces sp. NBC_01669]MCX4538757.1 DUF4262 domain-containing protein [Streptomyces sp. NBC_01669]